MPSDTNAARNTDNVAPFRNPERYNAPIREAVEAAILAAIKGLTDSDSSIADRSRSNLETLSHIHLG